MTDEETRPHAVATALCVHGPQTQRLRGARRGSPRRAGQVPGAGRLPAAQGKGGPKRRTGEPEPGGPSSRPRLPWRGSPDVTSEVGGGGEGSHPICRGGESPRGEAGGASWVPPGVQDGSWKPNGPLDGSGLRETTCRLLGAGAPGGVTGDQGPRFASQLRPRGRPWDPEIASSVPQGLSHLFPLTGEDGPALGGPQEPPLHSPSWRGRALGLGGSWPTTCRTPPLAASAPARTTTKGRDSGCPLSFHCYGACPARSQPWEPGS